MAFCNIKTFCVHCNFRANKLPSIPCYTLTLDLFGEPPTSVKGIEASHLDDFCLLKSKLHLLKEVLTLSEAMLVVPAKVKQIFYYIINERSSIKPYKRGFGLDHFVEKSLKKNFQLLSEIVVLIIKNLRNISENISRSYGRNSKF